MTAYLKCFVQIKKSLVQPQWSYATEHQKRMILLSTQVNPYNFAKLKGENFKTVSPFGLVNYKYKTNIGNISAVKFAFFQNKTLKKTLPSLYGHV